MDRNRMLCHPSFAWSLAICLMLTHHASAEDIPTSQVVKDLRSGITRLQAVEVRLAAWECVTEQTYGVGGKPMTGAGVVKRQGVSMLLDASQPQKTDRWRAVKNDSEMFTVTSRTGGQTWVMSGFVKLFPGESPKAPGGEQFATYPLLAVNIKRNILQLLDDKSFNPTRAQRVAENRVELDYELTDGKSTGRGTLTLAPDLDWLVVRSVITFPSSGEKGGSSRTTLSRDAIRDGDLIRVKSISHEVVLEGKPQYSNTSKYTYKFIAPDTVDPAEFTLDYYKLDAPESADAYEDRPPFNWRLWGSVGVTCIVLSVVLGWHIRRRLE